MVQEKLLSVANQLRGMPVLVPDTGEKLGEVLDALIHPTRGELLGIVLRTSSGKERLLATDDFFIVLPKGVVVAAEEARSDLESLSRLLVGGVNACGEILGIQVVTEKGKLLGRVCEVYILVDSPQVFYRIATSTWQRLFGGGFFMAGDVPHAYSLDGLRLIVPAETEEHYVATSLIGALGQLRGEHTVA